MKAPLALALALTLALVAVPGHAAPRNADPDWPCQSVKVGELSVGAVWNGAPLDDALKTWEQDGEAADLARRVSQRRLPIDRAESEIAAFAARQPAGDARAARLAHVMAGVFTILDGERTAVIEGLDRVGRRQKELAAAVRQKAMQLAAAQSAPDADEAKVNELSQGLGWDTRLFEQRRVSIQFACAVPNTIEQRLFALARAIQKGLG
jgi:hypothetical protein